MGCGRSRVRTRAIEGPKTLFYVRRTMATYPVLDTSRLSLRPPTLADAEGISEYGMDPDVSRYVTWPRHRSAADAVAYLKYAIEAAEKGHELTWVITLRSSHDVIGATSLRVQGPHRVELGYALRRSSWGQGFATETGRAVVEWALSQPNIHRVWAVCDVENLASAKVLEKVGMEREGLLRRWAGLQDFSTPRDCWCYAAVK